MIGDKIRNKLRPQLNNFNITHNSKVDKEKAWYQIKVFGGVDEVETKLNEKMSKIINDPIETVSITFSKVLLVFMCLEKAKQMRC